MEAKLFHVGSHDKANGHSSQFCNTSNKKLYYNTHTLLFLTATATIHTGKSGVYFPKFVGVLN